MVIFMLKEFRGTLNFAQFIKFNHLIILILFNILLYNYLMISFNDLYNYI